MPRVGSSRATSPGSSSPSIRPASAIASASRWRSPPERSRGSASTACSRPTTRSAASPGLARQLVADPLADQVVARVLGQQRDPAGRLDLAGGPARPDRRRSAAACSCRRRCGPSGPPARRGSTVRSMPRRTSCGSSSAFELDPEASSRRGRRVRGPDPLLHSTCSGGASAAGRRLGRRAVAVRRGSGPRHRRRSRLEGARGRRGRRRGGGRCRRGRRGAPPGWSRAGSAVVGPGEEVAGGAVEGDGARVHGDDAVGRGQAALQAVFGEQDRDAPLLVEAAQEPDQLVAGDRVELGGGLVEKDQARAGDQGRGEGDALQLAAGEGVDGAVRAGAGSRGPGRPPRPRGRGRRARRRASPGAARSRRRPWSRRPGSRGPGRRSRPTRGQLARAGLDRVEAGDVDGAVDLAAVEVRDQAAGGFQQGRLAARPSGRRAGRTRPGASSRETSARAGAAARG